MLIMVAVYIARVRHQTYIHYDHYSKRRLSDFGLIGSQENYLSSGKARGLN